jgi:hypothetical protein
MIPHEPHKDGTARGLAAASAQGLAATTPQGRAPSAIHLGGPQELAKASRGLIARSALGRRMPRRSRLRRVRWLCQAGRK